MIREKKTVTVGLCRYKYICKGFKEIINACYFLARMKYNKLMFVEKQLKWKGTYLPRRVSSSLAKLGPFFLAYAIFFTDIVVHCPDRL